ncbi:MAG TPA: hypothetical protein VKX17_06425 [Planctomycetota bacterium]|nr:hypothetical protein [Planctomycetota bacterium]
MNLTDELNHTRAFEIESWSNGYFYEITRKSDGASVFLQGDDAIRLSDELERTTERFTDDDVVWQYFD